MVPRICYNVGHETFSISIIIGALAVKFKLIFILFNAIVVISFLFVFLMPLFVLGFEYTAGFWAQNWYLVLVFAGILVLLDGYFILNWRLFQLLEKEDWPALSLFLEERIFQKKRFGDQSIRLLCNAWVVQGKPLEILRLETLLRAEKPALVARHGLLLGIPYLLKNDTSQLLAFFEPLAAMPKVADQEWIRFNLAFGLLAERRAEEAVKLLDGLAGQTRETIIQLLAIYLLDSNTASGDEAGSARLAAAKQAFLGRFGRDSFNRVVDKQKENLEVIILSKFITEAADWIFAVPAPVASTADEAKS
jgi:hypothetical protein